MLNLNNLCIPCDSKKESKCTHGKVSYYCIECNGKGLCEHNKRKKYCHDCDGSALCIHKKRKYRCKECGGSELCEHNKSKYRCKECGGIEICIHKKIKKYCHDCDGSGLCIHKKRKSRCTECGGCDLCQHGRQKAQCKECGGTSICEHGKRKPKCKKCGGSDLCKSSWCETICNPKYEKYCLACFVNNPENQNKPNTRNYKTKETDVVDRIKQTFTNFTWVSDKKVQDGCSRRRPDLLLDMGTHIIIVEVDENKHTDYDCSCENKRLMELSQDLQHRPIVFIRFNPDNYTNQEGTLVKSCWKLNKLGVIQIMKSKEKEWDERINILKQQIQYWIVHSTEKTIEIIQLFY